MKKWLGITVLLLLFPLISHAETISVSPGNGTITKALSACADGDVIELGDGVYAEPEEAFPLTITRRVTIRAADGASPVIDAPEMKAALRVEAGGVTLEDLEIRFRRTGIYAIGNDMSLNRCRIILADENWRVSSCGIWCGGIFRMALRDCAFTGCSVALAGPPLSERSENLPKLTGLFEVGEDPEFFTSHLIENCTVNGKPLFYAASLPSVTPPDGCGEIICCGCDEVSVRDTAVSDGSMGIVLAYNQQIRVENTRADRCGLFGIYVAKCSGGRIAGCTSEGTNHGFDIRADRNITLENCTAVSCEQGLFFSFVTDSVMKDCSAIDTRQGFFTACGSGNTLTGCLASGCENGFHLEKEGNLLMASCTAEKCTVCGVRADKTPGDFVHNTLRRNWVAFMAYGNASLDIADNIFDENENCALYFRNIGFSRVIGNRFTGSTQYGLVAIGSMSGSIWAGNAPEFPADLSRMTDGFVRMD